MATVDRTRAGSVRRVAGLQKLSALRHGAVGIVVVGTGVLGATGTVGGGVHPERYDAWHVVVAPAGGNALRITETYDQDFGTHDRHGHERTIPNDFGVPTDIEVSSPDAPDDLDVDPMGGETRIRIGDPDETITGQHRYVLSYTLPEARVETGLLALDVIEEHAFDVGVAEIVVTGFELAQPRCFVGGFGSTDECDLVRDGGVYRATFSDLEAGTGITIDGRITGSTDVLDVPEPPLPDRRAESPELLGAGLGALALVTAVPIYRWARRRGSNEVFAGGAADAAFGELPPPGATGAGAAAAAAPGVRWVSDDDLPDLATIEFVPPEGIDPWEAAVLLSEKFSDDAVANYLSGLAGKEVITLGEVDGDLSIAKGPEYSLVTDPGEAEMLDGIWRLGDPYVAKGTYNAAFARSWKNIGAKLAERIETSGWWKRGTPSQRVMAGSGFVAVALMVAIGVPIFFGAGALEFLKYWPVAIAFAVLVPALVAILAYATMLPARSAHGSALALRAESFRRFLAASEGRHVEWAWKHGLLRVYSAWAVALGAADAWSRALAEANVPEPEVYTAPLLVYSHRSDLSSTYTKPSSSSSSSSGGFSGGSVGGGGGGGSSGSW
jgi:uncharacterized membrane protein YgcG